MARIEFFATVRGEEVKILADGLERYCGLYGFDEVYAETLDGEPFDLTDEEVERFGIQATEAVLNDPD